MKAFLYHVFGILAHLGGLGLVALGILDSSFLFMPLGNDILMIALTARRHGHMPYYALMATAGSVLGCVLVDLVSRKGGEKGLERRLSRRRLEYVKRKVSNNAAWALGFASLMPPPFPFTPFVIAASALQYPRKKLFAVIAATRFVRFLGAGIVGIVFGRRIIHMAENPVFQYSMLGLLAVFAVGSVLSIVHWVRRSKHASPAAGPEA
jgi:membrane protein YqaA with SNARE-associated domain